MKRKYRLSLIFYPQDCGGFTVICPELPGCLSDGGTYEEAASNIKALIPEWLSKELEDETSAEYFAEGLAVEGKIFQEVEYEA